MTTIFPNISIYFFQVRVESVRILQELTRICELCKLELVYFLLDVDCLPLLATFHFHERFIAEWIFRCKSCQTSKRYFKALFRSTKRRTRKINSNDLWKILMKWQCFRPSFVLRNNLSYLPSFHRATKFVFIILDLELASPRRKDARVFKKEKNKKFTHWKINIFRSTTLLIVGIYHKKIK